MLKITKTGSYVPSNKYTNDEMSKFLDTSDEWIYSRTGIKSRNFAIDMQTTDLAYKAIKNLNVNLDDIDMIIVATSTPEFNTPQTANLLQERLGLNKKEVFCLDINSACTGFIYGLEVVRSLMLTKKNINKAILVGAEKMSSIVDFTDRNTCVLFGDGAGCILIEKATNGEIFEGFVSSMGDDKGLLKATRGQTACIKTKEAKLQQPMKMAGREVFKFAVGAIKKSIEEVLRLNNLSIDDIDLIIPHQANKRIISKAAKVLEVNEDKFFSNLENLGNTSAASIPLAFDEALKKGKVKEGSTVLFVGFGGGLSYGAIIAKI